MAPTDESPGIGAMLRRPPPMVRAVAVVFVAVAFVGAITFYSAREFSSRAADTRASAEAKSFAEHSARLATGDAFAGYLQMLRYADDPILRSKDASPADRNAALQSYVYLNTNKMAGLAIANRAGTILASTDPAIDDMRGSEAFNDTRANLGPANSDIILPEAGKSGYVEFTAPLKDADGTVWAILYGRADPARLWTGTLAATVDGGRNVIINNEGQFSAGVPDTFLRSSWRGVPIANGSVRADIAGVDSICGLGSVGQDTQIDHGWNVASCLPVSLIQAEAGGAMGDQGLVTLAAAVLAIAVAGMAMRFVVAPQGTPARSTAAPRAVREEALPVALIVEPWPPLTEAAAMLADVTETEEQPEAEITPTVTADVDALSLIEAYERRNAALAERLRDAVQARIMLAASELDQAYRLVTIDAARAATLHERAMADLEQLRERELRSLGQELHPGLVRIGLPGAFKSLRKDLQNEIALDLDIDPGADSVSGGADRTRVDGALRLVLYRVVRDAARALAAAGAPSCALTLRRSGDVLSGALTGETGDSAFDGSALRASELALQAYGSALGIATNGTTVAVTWDIHAPDVAPADEGIWAERSEADAWTAEPAVDALEAVPAAASNVRTFSLPETAEDVSEEIADEPGPLAGALPANVITIPADSIDATPLSERLASVVDDLRPHIAVTLEIAAAADARTLAGDPQLPPALATELVTLARAAGRALADAGAPAALVAVQVVDGDVFVSVSGDAGDQVDAALLAGPRDAVEARDGFFSVSRRGDTTTITAEIPAQTGDAPAVIRINPAPFVEAPDDAADDPLPEIDLSGLLASEDDAPAA